MAGSVLTEPKKLQPARFDKFSNRVEPHPQKIARFSAVQVGAGGFRDLTVFLHTPNKQPIPKVGELPILGMQANI